MNVPSDATAGRAAFFKIFPTIALPVLLAMIDQSIVATALPNIAAHFGAVDQIALVVSAYLVCAAIAAPIAGALGDRMGRKALLLWSLGLSMTGATIAGFAHSFEILILGRVFQGLAGGGMMTLSQALLGQAVPARQRAQYQGFVAGLGMVAATTGPGLGGLLVQAFGWSWVFFVLIPFQLLGVLIGWRLQDTSKRQNHGRFDWIGMVYLSLAIVTLLTAFSLVADAQAFAMPSAIGALILGVIMIILLIRRQRRVPAPILPMASLVKPAIWRICLTTLCHGATFVSLLTFIPLYLSVLRGMSPASVGLAMLPMTIGIGIGSTLAGLFISRSGWLGPVPALGLMIVFLNMSLFAVFAPSWTNLIILAMLGWNSLWLGTVMGSAHTISLLEAEPNELGAVAGAIQLARSVGAAIGASIIGLLLIASISLAGIGEPTLVLHQAFDEAARQSGAAGAAPIIEPYLAKVFLAIAALAGVGSLIAWTNPRRRLEP
ncbi:MFS transporter [Pelagibacterium sp.]|uniref:MFS transporter n=1 Tax=Pelagibacterium sp. TaxID=1967288 RepID=UPI003A8FCAF8